MVKLSERTCSLWPVFNFAHYRSKSPSTLLLFLSPSPVQINKYCITFYVLCFTIQDGKKVDFGFLFDIDGVIVRGKKLLPSAKDAFNMLVDDKGKFKVPVLFVTNAGNTLRQNKAKDLTNWLGIEVSSH